ncbi:hypothetical protein ABZZ20_28585 [Streptomyces sp. NPDC006430]|uniref:hypothetical protein n=1 Tax=Streptomyces sp. NPDC006430 TaxID=3154299 RepID=UPI0033A08B4B
MLGATASTVRDYGAAGYLRTVQCCGRTWYPRADVAARRGADDRRHHPELTGAGCPRGSTDRVTRHHPDPPIAETAAALALAASGGRALVTSGETAEHYGVGERTAQRLLREAREQAAEV